nr:alpha/beta fold hydrolase [Burkholderia territorii]
MNAEYADDDLARFDAQGGTPLPAADTEGWLDHDGARIWHASFGHGLPVVLLHGGLGHGGNWGNQVPALLEAGYRAIVIDSRGHGRSTRDDRPYSYERMAGDVLAVLDALASGAHASSAGATGRAYRSCWPPARRSVLPACSSSHATWIRAARRRWRRAR